MSQAFCLDSVSSLTHPDKGLGGGLLELPTRKPSTPRACRGLREGQEEVRRALEEVGKEGSKRKVGG